MMEGHPWYDLANIYFHIVVEIILLVPFCLFSFFPNSSQGLDWKFDYKIVGYTNGDGPPLLTVSYRI